MWGSTSSVEMVLSIPIAKHTHATVRPGTYIRLISLGYRQDHISLANVQADLRLGVNHGNGGNR